MKIKNILILVFVFLSSACSNQTYVQKHQGNDNIQSLSQINEIARSFMKSYNKENKTNWKALEPNSKTLVHRCMMPLEASWGKQTLADIYPKQTLNGTNWHIKVHCNRSVSTEQNKGWLVIVPTNKPYVETH